MQKILRRCAPLAQPACSACTLSGWRSRFDGSSRSGFASHCWGPRH